MGCRLRNQTDKSHTNMKKGTWDRPMEGDQASLGFWIVRCGFQIPGRVLRIPIQWNFRITKLRIPNTTSKNFSVWNPDFLTWGDFKEA